MEDMSNHDIGTPEDIQRFINYAREQAFIPEGIDYTPCYKREKNAFVLENDIEEEDIRNCIDTLDLEQFCHISKKAGKDDAYVFGVRLDWLDPLIYMKLKVCEGVVVISFHEPVYPLTFPYRQKEGK